MTRPGERSSVGAPAASTGARRASPVARFTPAGLHGSASLTIRATLAALKQARGHLLLTGSVAGRRALPGSLYSATKWAVTAMGESARQELNGTGVRVTLIEPGMVDTPFFENPVSDALTADDIARAVMFAVSQPEHVDINEILVRPTAQDG